MNENRDYTDVPEERQYTCKCGTCGEYFTGGKNHMTCKSCADAYQEKIKDLTEEEIKQIGEICKDIAKQCVSFIKAFDKTVNKDADDSEPVVGLNVLEMPITTGMIDAFYQGYLKGKHNELVTDEINPELKCRRCGTTIEADDDNICLDCLEEIQKLD